MRAVLVNVECTKYFFLEKKNFVQNSKTIFKLKGTLVNFIRFLFRLTVISVKKKFQNFEPQKKDF